MFIAHTDNFSTATTPNVPGTPQYSSITFSAVNIVWTVPGFNGGANITSYTLQCSSNNITFNNFFVGADNAFNASGLSPDSTYYCRVFATNSVGNSSNSAITSFTTLSKYLPSSKSILY
jgi:hypothetical protein